MLRPLWLAKIRAFSIHWLLSMALALLAAALVFGLWYPYPYRDISGGRELFWLVVSVDVVLGPLITLTVFNPVKSRREKLLDFGVIGLLQLGALLYGLWAVAQARPVHTVFEYDRFRVVHAAEIIPELLGKAPAELQALPKMGPTYISLRPMVLHEQLDMTMAALGGMPLSARPELWQSYEAGRGAILQAAHPASTLAGRFPLQRPEIERGLADTGVPIDELVYLPLMARKETVWTAILDRRDARVVGYLPLDSF
ncbi:MAG: TfpX/TfpZ family type IV pilin accessory protein [Comamonas sp.]